MSSNLIRLGGLVSIVGGVVYAVGSLLLAEGPLVGGEFLLYADSIATGFFVPLCCQ
jgi:hypothetical protein